MKKKDIVTVDLDKPVVLDWDYGKLGRPKGLTKKQWGKFLRAVAAERQTLNNHFKEKHHGWDLAFDCIRAEILRQTVGVDFCLLVMSALAGKGREYRLVPGNGLMICKASKKKRKAK